MNFDSKYRSRLYANRKFQVRLNVCCFHCAHTSIQTSLRSKHYTFMRLVSINYILICNYLDPLGSTCSLQPTICATLAWAIRTLIEYRPLRAKTVYVYSDLPWQKRVTDDILIISSQWKPCIVIGINFEICMLVNLFCHGRSGWT